MKTTKGHGMWMPLLLVAVFMFIIMHAQPPRPPVELRQAPTCDTDANCCAVFPKQPSPYCD